MDPFSESLALPERSRMARMRRNSVNTVSRALVLPERMCLVAPLLECRVTEGEAGKPEGISLAGGL